MRTLESNYQFHQYFKVLVFAAEVITTVPYNQQNVSINGIALHVGIKIRTLRSSTLFRILLLKLSDFGRPQITES